MGKNWASQKLLSADLKKQTHLNLKLKTDVDFYLLISKCQKFSHKKTGKNLSNLKVKVT